MGAGMLALRLAGRELRGGLRGFGIFLACLTLGVAAIAGVGSLAASVDAGLNCDARQVLGGDVEFHLVNRPAGPAQRAALEAGGAVSEIIELRSMARAPEGERRSLVEAKAVDGAYPLYGTVELAPAMPLAEALARKDGTWGAVLDPVLLERLDLKLGDTLRLGEGSFVIRATLVKEPDFAANLFIFGPRVMVAMEGLRASGLLQPGALVGYSYRVRLGPSETAKGFGAGSTPSSPMPAGASATSPTRRRRSSASSTA